MKRVLHIAMTLIALAAAIGIGWSMNGYDLAALRPDAPAWLAALFSFPLTMALTGTAMIGIAAVTKRASFTESSKANWLAAAALLFGPSLCLIVQAGLPLLARGQIEKSALLTTLFAFMVGFFLIVGNYITTTRRDGFGGLRNRYTLADEVVWAKSQRMMGRAIVLAVLAGIPSILFVKAITAIYIVVGLKVAAIAFAHVYSWHLAQRRAGTARDNRAMIDAPN